MRIAMRLPSQLPRRLKLPSLWRRQKLPSQPRSNSGDSLTKPCPGQPGRAFLFMRGAIARSRFARSDVSENLYLKIDFNSIEKSRIHLFKTRSLSLPAYAHISNIDSFIQNLKYWCFNVSKEYYCTANKLFQFLLSFEEHFKNTYRSSEILSNSHNLKMFS